MAATMTAATMLAPAPALRLRTGVRAYLQCDPVERGKNSDAVRSLNKAMAPFPLLVEARTNAGMALQARAAMLRQDCQGSSPNCMTVPSQELWIA